jgi:glycosyltransferase involved in cell wall biosynthesis
MNFQPMRIASISLHWPRTKDSGVGKKLDQQVRLWQAGGHEARLFMHTSRYAPLSALVPAEVIPFDMDGKLRTEWNRIKAAQELVAAVRNYHPDVIYLRLAMYVFPVHQLSSISPVVGEINTNDPIQHKELGIVLSLYNLLTRGILLRRVSGLVSVSDELARHPSYASYRKPARVISNGIDLSAFQPLEAPNNEIPRLVFIGTPGYSWHGVDKLVELANEFPDLRIDIVGYNHLPEFTPLPPNLTLHGYLNADDYRKVMAGCDLAISTLALHRKDMEEACSLKTRECLAYGLPVVLPYIDTDLKDLDCDFLLKIPNKEDNIQTHGQAIRDFAYRMLGRRVDRQLITSIDQVAKEAARIRFFEEILSNRRA